ncbi:hypothetical protein [Paenisporosarcina indica]|uniref:hypothetical protein n=1 Tax=Paenisporosarcina indica TaxID=650093 RepID=UPI0009500069|nr:hypothetical protein [Paenisporosarcina indica]
MSNYDQQLNELRVGTRTSLTIEKEDFLSFREVLVQMEDFKHFRGVAKQGGILIYTYEKEARS